METRAYTYKSCIKTAAYSRECYSPSLLSMRSDGESPSLQKPVNKKQNKFYRTFFAHSEPPHFCNSAVMWTKESIAELRSKKKMRNCDCGPSNLDFRNSASLRLSHFRVLKLRKTSYYNGGHLAGTCCMDT
jgi:hypothetical protein